MLNGQFISWDMEETLDIAAFSAGKSGAIKVYLSNTTIIPIKNN